MQMQSLMLMFAGSDTTRESHRVLVGILPDLPPRITDSLREEQRRVVAKHGPDFTRAALAEMRYAYAMAREVLRIWGPSEYLFRRARHGARRSVPISPAWPYSCCECPVVLAALQQSAC